MMGNAMDVDEAPVNGELNGQQVGLTGQQVPMDDTQVKNTAGGYVWKVTGLDQFKRFLVLGTSDSTYNAASDKKLGIENALVILNLIASGNGKEVVEVIKRFSVDGRCAKQESIILSLAICARNNKCADTKRAAYKVLNEVCRIPTHLFHFVVFCEEISKSLNGGTTGWGRAHRKAISNWYTDPTKDAQKIAFQITKYKQRDGWSHKDLLRLCHVKAGDDRADLGIIFKYIVKGYDGIKDQINCMQQEERVNKILGYFDILEKVKKEDNEDNICQYIVEHRLNREHLPTKFLNSKKVWVALLNGMPLNAMIRNLGKMSSMGMFKNCDGHSGEEFATKVAQRLLDQEILKYAKIHPFNVLIAMKQYATGHGELGKLSWDANHEILQALDQCFYLSFKFVEPTGKRFLLGIDVSGSMTYGGCNGCPIIQPAEAAAAMAMVTLKTEKDCLPMGFSRTLVDLNLTRDMDLPGVCREVRRVMMGSTDCAQPMIQALKRGIKVDVFIIYTDCETWIGPVHPAAALKEYREKMNIPEAKLIVCAMTSTGFTIADPTDPFMLDMVGFDSGAPEIISLFAKGEL